MEDVGGVRALLGSSVVFEHLPPAGIDLVFAQAQLVHAKPGQLLLTEGRPGDGLYVVLEGEVEVFLPERAARGAHRPTPVTSPGSSTATCCDFSSAGSGTRIRIST